MNRTLVSERTLLVDGIHYTYKLQADTRQEGGRVFGSITLGDKICPTKEYRLKANVDAAIVRMIKAWIKQEQEQEHQRDLAALERWNKGLPKGA